MGEDLEAQTAVPDNGKKGKLYFPDPQMEVLAPAGYGAGYELG
jgi:hypothetical protein